MTVEAGKLRHRFRIDEFVDVLDSAGDAVRGEQGEFLKEWQEFATVWGALEPLSAREFLQSAAMQSQVTARIVLRFMDGLRADMRFTHLRTGRPDTYYNPAGFLADKDSGLEYLTIPVSAGVSDGQ